MRRKGKMRSKRRRRMIRNKFVRTKMRPKVGAKIELQREISQIGLQVTCYRLFADVLQVA